MKKTIRKEANLDGDEGEGGKQKQGVCRVFLKGEKTDHS